MSNIITAQVEQPWRVLVAFVSAFVGQDVVGSFSLLRSNAVPHPLDSAWTQSGSVVQLALAEALVPGELYTLAHAGSATTVQVAFRLPPAVLVGLPVRVEDPEAEIFGADWDWLADGLTVSGDIPEVRGLMAFRHDLAALALTAPGELIHRPHAGAGLLGRVNGATSPGELEEIRGTLRAAYLADDRVRGAEVQVLAEVTRGLPRAVLRAQVLTVPLEGETIDLAVRL